MEFKFTYIPEDNDDSTVIENEKKHQTADYSSYQLPGADLLIPQDEDDYDHKEEIQRKSTQILDALESFGVNATIEDIDCGPRVTRYHVVPAKGVKVSRIINLENDIALSLAVQSIRIEAPIPGKNAIGIYIPNDYEKFVRLGELVDTDEFRSKKQKTTVCLGKDVTGSPVFSDIESLPHLLIAGATGMGKSICIDTFILSMLYKARPDEVKFILMDPKMVEFSKYNGIPHLLVPVITDTKHAAGALSWALEEMYRRYELIAKAQVSNIAAYNEMVKANTSLGETLPRIVIVIDELADLMMEVRCPVEDLVQSLAQKARAAGIHLIVGTQRPDVNVLTGTIRANIPGRISCRVASNVDSRTIIDSVGAEKLLPQGDMLYKSGSLKLTRVQGAYVSHEEVKKVIGFIKSQTQGESYDEEVMTRILSEAKKIGNKCSDDYAFDNEHNNKSEINSHLNDIQFLSAVDVALSQGQISTALLQRKLSIGFGKAARFIDLMEGMGIISSKNGAKPRNVLITRDEWVDRFTRMAIDEYDNDASDIGADEDSKSLEDFDINDLFNDEDHSSKSSKTLGESAKRIIQIMDASDENSTKKSPSYETVASMIKIVAIGTDVDVDKFMEAINHAVYTGTVSTAMLQRKMGIGFGKAAKFIDLMEEMGIASKKSGMNPREVLMSERVWRDVLKKLENE